MQNLIIAPSILAANFAYLADDINAVIAAGADWIHFDVMDAHYVANLTVGPVVCKALRDANITAPIDVHLMVTMPEQLIAQFAAAGATSISIHPETVADLGQTLGLIKSFGCNTGIAINPYEQYSLLQLADSVLANLDLILVMTVVPGKGGQQLLPEVLPKLAALRREINEIGLPIRLAVDGGITLENAAEVINQGADTLVAGTAIFKSADYAAALNKLRAAYKLHNHINL